MVSMMSLGEVLRNLLNIFSVYGVESDLCRGLITPTLKGLVPAPKAPEEDTGMWCVPYSLTALHQPQLPR